MGGFIKESLTDTNVLLAGGGDMALSSFIGTLNWDSTNKKILYKKVGDTNWTDLADISGAWTDNNTWRKVLVGGTERLGSATNTGDLKFVNGTNTTVTWNTTNKTILIDGTANTWRKVVVAGSDKLGTGTNTGDLKFVSGTYTTVTWNTTNKTILYDCNLIRSGTATSLTNLDITKSFIYVTLSANVAASAFTVSAAMTVGQCLTVLVYNSGSATISIAVPSAWKSLDGYNLTCGATKFIEISIVKYASGANDYILSSKAQ